MIKHGLFRVLTALIILGVLLSALPISTPPVFAFGSTIFSSTSDGYIVKSFTDYDIAHDAASGDSVSKLGFTWNVGQRLSSGNFYIQRAAVYFDTSGLPDNAYIASC